MAWADLPGGTHGLAAGLSINPNVIIGLLWPSTCETEDRDVVELSDLADIGVAVRGD